jgi:predicted acyl esterase
MVASVASTDTTKTQIQDGMRIDWDVEIEMDDGVILRADVYRPIEAGAYPTVASMGVYGKNLPFQDPPYDHLWEQMAEKYPDVPAGSTNKYQAWEVVDPEKWVPHGYAVLRIDSRGAGRSEGVIDCFTTREARDLYDCIEWAAAQPWSNGKVGLSGISYYAVNQWHVAALKPPHLAAICPWEGAGDWYREATHHGGIHTTFLGRWFGVQAAIVQHGLGSRGPVNPHNGLQVCGDEDLTDEELAANRGDIKLEVLEHRFDDDYYRERSAKYQEIDTPLLSAANWGGQALHNRGNLRGYMYSSSPQKWLEVHGGEHWTLYYTDYGNELQRRFFDWFLKGEGDWDQQPPVLLNIRHPGERFVPRAENEWPIARTDWTKLYLDPKGERLDRDKPQAESQATYQGFGEGLTLWTEPFEEEMEITGPVACRLWISSDTTDADIFLALRVFDEDGKEVLFHGANEPKAPISLGWLRASHRKLDEERSEPWAPYHPHQEEEALTPGELYALDVEIWPTCIVIPPGYRLALSVLGRDFDHGLEGVPSHLGVEMRGAGFWRHDEPQERPAEIYDGNVTVHGGGERESYLLLPVIPTSREDAA